MANGNGYPFGAIDKPQVQLDDRTPLSQSMFGEARRDSRDVNSNKSTNVAGQGQSHVSATETQTGEAQIEEQYFNHATQDTDQ